MGRRPPRPEAVKAVIGVTAATSGAVVGGGLSGLGATTAGTIVTAKAVAIASAIPVVGGAHAAAATVAIAAGAAAAAPFVVAVAAGAAIGAGVGLGIRKIVKGY